jgi:GMP synthase (glutamine-hydrolysing)
MTQTHDKILIVDFGSQVTQLIARRVREEGVYSEVVPFQKAAEAIRTLKPKGVILSGGPESVTTDTSPRAPADLFQTGLPVFGICYGQQTMAAQLGGAVEGGHHSEFGRAEIEILTESPLFQGVWQVGKKYPGLDEPRRPGHPAAGRLRGAGGLRERPFAVVADEEHKFYGVQFHPEVVHTPQGAQLIRNFVRDIAGAGATGP